jgi:cobaltochelatase CobN
MNEWIANYTTVDSDTLNKFKQAFTEATKKEIQVQTKSSSSSRENHVATSSKEKPADKQQVVSTPEKPAEPPKDTPAPEPNQAGSQPEPAAPVPRQAGGETREEQAEAGQSQGPAVEVAAQLANQKAGEAGESGQAGEAGVKGYEVEVKKEEQSSGAGRKAVTAFAILGALGVVAVFAKGYLAGRR